MLGVSILLETYSLLVALKEFRHIRAGRGVRRTLKEARDPTVMTVLFEDLAALFGLFVAFGGIFLTRVTGDVVWDGAGLDLRRCGARRGGVVLARDTKSLLIGKGVTPPTKRRSAPSSRPTPTWSSWCTCAPCTLARTR